MTNSLSAILTDTERQAVNTVVSELKSKPGALLPILHGIQDAIGYIPPAAVAIIAEALRQTRAEVHGVISFYHEFRTTPGGRHTVQICRAEACQARGSRSLERHVHSRLGIGYHQTTLDGEISLEPVYCLGNCACGPAVRIGNDIYGRVDSRRFDQLVDELTTVPVTLQMMKSGA